MTNSTNKNEVDLEELVEWKDAFASVIKHAGAEQAKAILDELAAIARLPAVQ